MDSENRQARTCSGLLRILKDLGKIEFPGTTTLRALALPRHAAD